MQLKITFVIFFTVSLTTFIFAQQNQIEIPKLKRGEEKICHIAYCLVYSEPHEQAKWVAYTLTKNMIENKVKRTNKFIVDPKVSTGTANNKDYKYSGYDRGHLAPAADISFTKTSMEESFYYSNMSPQKPGFNRGIWKSLETEVREYAKNLNIIYVVTGPILSSGLEEIGANNVDIPEYYYKAILYVSDTSTQGIAFVMPNEKIKNKSIYDFAISIDLLEEKIGINLFCKLPFFLERRTEKKYHQEFWENCLQEKK